MLKPRPQSMLRTLSRLPSSPLRSSLHHRENHARIPTPQQCRHQHITREVSKFSLVPRILRKSTWDMVIPKFLRKAPAPFASSSSGSSAQKRKARNPATYFIWIYLLIGSQAIRIISVQSEFTAYTRRADLRLEKLREVLKKLQAGEEVDVEGTLGTGVESEEKEWEEAMREIEEEEDKWVRSRRKMREKEEARKKEDERRAAEAEQEEERRRDASPVARQPVSKIVSAAGFY